MLKKSNSIITFILSIGLILSGCFAAWYAYKLVSLYGQQQSSSALITKNLLSIPMHQSQLALSLSLFFCLLCSILLFGIKFIKKPSYWWAIACLVSILALIEISIIWQQSYTHISNIQQEGYFPISNHSDIAIIATGDRSNYVTIPTGIFINNLTFTRKDNDIYPGFLLKGYVWQKYTKGVHDVLTKGVMFPHAAKKTMEKLYTINDGDQEIICWEFFAEIFQRFDLSKFPFDHHHVKITMAHPDFTQNVILVPDLKSYPDYEHNGSVFKNDFKIAHWLIENKFYCYSFENYPTSFGISNFSMQSFPDLHYYIIANRELTDTVMIYFMLLLVSAVILFVALLAFLKHEQLTGLMGFSTLGILGVCSSLLFVLISSQIELRDSIAIEGTSYLEYMYAIMYCMIIFVSLDCVLFTLFDIKWITYKDNFIVKLLYWPILLVTIVIVSFFTFY